MLWIATFGDVTKYMREKESAQLKTSINYGKIKVRLMDTINSQLYNVPLTLKTYVPAQWSVVYILKAKHFQRAKILHDSKGAYVTYLAKVNSGAITLATRY